MTNHDLIKKVVGNIFPNGDFIGDKEAYENLQNMCTLISQLLFDIDELIYKNELDEKESVKKVVNYAKKFTNEDLITFIKS